MLFQRVVTALVLAPLMLAGIYLLPAVWFSAFIGAIVVLGAWEWANLAGYQRMTSRLGLAALTAGLLVAISWVQNATPVTWLALTLWSLLWWVLALALVVAYPASQGVIRRRWVRLLIAIPVLLPLWLGLNVLKAHDQANLVLTWLMLLVWGADIGAYFAGRAFGNRKLAPHVSPGKTWAGVYGGMATSVAISAIIGIAFLADLDGAQWGLMLFVSAVVVAISVLGDLLESLLKRYRGIKDSSHLLPGHGGILDRIDSLCAATPMFCLLLALVAV
ncbi:phosphatidate cytidylyltransferase [Saccharospirillum salsuginis]|uniref:phosphatidate cytidylyltransferase n=1 Tax=Saccharospirillum salsuginis TaxID=418750 RepID=UPI0016777DD6|nr:phosphatidate cytidylyltransferase [Saccharospirillum salsuginis]